MELSDKTFNALQKLARSAWGAPAGVGGCKDKAVWIDLVHQGYARPIKSESTHILSLTLHGFRILEAERWRRELESKSA
jgi:hypothetical protein